VDGQGQRGAGHLQIPLRTQDIQNRTDAGAIAQLGIPHRPLSGGGGSSRASAALAQRQAEQQQITIETAQQAIIQSVQTWWYSHQAASQQITAAEAAAAAGDLAVRDAQLRYRAGIGPILDVLSTQRDLQVARSSLALAIHRWNLSRAGLEMETGS
jgi:outer membrane protein